MPLTTYRITVAGRLTEHLGSAFEGFVVEPGRGQTFLVGEIRDQAHLYGVLERVRNLGLELVGVHEDPRAVGDSKRHAPNPDRQYGCPQRKA